MSRNPLGYATQNNTLTDMAMGYFRSRVLSAAARLGVADALGDDERTVEQLAAVCSAQPASLYRLLRALASFGVVAETKPASFVLTPFGDRLRKDALDSEWASVVFWGDLLADSWTYLTDCVRTGKSAADVRPPEIPSRWSQDPGANDIFRAIMGTAPAEDYAPIARAWDFAKHHVIADLGGGGGALIAAILATYPHLSGILIDRPESVEAAAQRLRRDGLEPRCKTLAADLRNEVPAGADVYILQQVLHGYDDEAAIDILRNVRSVLPPQGRILIIEFVLPDVIDHADPGLEGRAMSDLNMLAVTGGKERSAFEWKTLLHRAGIEYRSITPVSGDLASIIEGRSTPDDDAPAGMRTSA